MLADISREGFSKAAVKTPNGPRIKPRKQPRVRAFGAWILVIHIASDAHIKFMKTITK